MKTLDQLIEMQRQSRAMTWEERVEFCKLLLAERDSLERVVSAPEARDHERREADLGPVSAPGSLLIEQIAFACQDADAKRHGEWLMWTRLPTPRMKIIVAAVIMALYSRTIQEQAEAARAAVAAQGELSRRANT